MVAPPAGVWIRPLMVAVNALGRSQAVRQRILIPPYGGSNPPAPARQARFPPSVCRVSTKLRYFRGLKAFKEVSTALKPKCSLFLTQISLRGLGRSHSDLRFEQTAVRRDWFDFEQDRFVVCESRRWAGNCLTGSLAPYEISLPPELRSADEPTSSPSRRSVISSPKPEFCSTTV
jgi:hypothetical protein